MLRAIAGEVGEPIVFTHPGEPIPKARARTVRVRGRTVSFTPSATRSAEDQLAWSMRLAARGRTFDGDLALALVFHRSTRRRCDLDNLAKLAMDAGNRSGIWTDDSQIKTLVVRIEIDAARPRTEAALAPTSSSLARSNPRRK